MKKIVFLTALTALFVTTHSANAQDPIGYVETKQGLSGEDFWLIRNAEKINPKAGTPLYVNDEVVIKTEGASASLRLSGYKSVVKLNAGDTLTIVQPADQTMGARASEFIKSITWSFKLTDREEVRNTAARNNTTSSDTQNYTPLFKTPRLDAPKLYATHDFTSLTVRYCGDSSRVEAWISPNAPLFATVESAVYGSASLSGLKEESEFEGLAGPSAIAVLPVSTKDKPLLFPVKWIEMNDVPKPKNLGAYSELTPDEKFYWAKWLITETSKQHNNAYSLIAVNLLTETRDEYWPAGLYLETITSCE